MWMVFSGGLVTCNLGNTAPLSTLVIDLIIFDSAPSQLNSSLLFRFKELFVFTVVGVCVSRELAPRLTLPSFC